MISSQSQPDNLKQKVLKIIKENEEINLSKLASLTQESRETLQPLLAELQREEIILSVNPERNDEIVYQFANSEVSAETDKTSSRSSVFSFVKNKFAGIAGVIWAVVIIVVIIPLIGQVFISQSFQADPPVNTENPLDPSKTPLSSDKNNKEASSKIDWVKYEQKIRNKLQNARQEAKQYASSELNNWGEDLIAAVDNNFLDWYFGYFNQKQIEYKAFFTGISAHTQQWLNPDSATPEEQIAEQITEDFELEFAKRVLRPSISQMRLSRIMGQTAKKYLSSLKQDFYEIPVSTGMSRLEWQQYLQDTSVYIPDLEGNIISFPLMRVSTAAAYIAVKPAIKAALPAVGTKVAGKLAGKAGAKIAGKTAGVIAGKVGSTLLDATVGAGIILWDIWDTNRSASIEKPILREYLVDYIHELEESTLDNPDTGIMSVVDRLDRSFFQSLTAIKNLDSVN